MLSNNKSSIQNLSNLKTSEISYGYYEIDYLDEKLLLRQHDNYINISKILATNHTTFKDWYRNKSSKDLVDEIFELINGHKKTLDCANVPKPIDENIIDIEPLYYIEGSNNIKGTYAHQLLVPHILSWLSPKIAVKVSMIVNKYLIDEKDRKIFDLEHINKKLDTEFNFIKNQNNLLLTKNDSLLIEVGSLKDSININNEKVDVVSNNFSNQLNKLVISTPPEKKKDIHYFIILDRNDGGYYCIRRKYQELNKEIKRIGGDILYYVQTGNAFALYDSLKNSGLIVYTKNNFRLKITNTEKELFIFIKNKIREIPEPIQKIKESIKQLKIDIEEDLY